MMERRACFSECRKYRYMLSVTWDEDKEAALFIGLNPSTADEFKNDPTVRRCIGFAKSWGYGSLWMGNLFSYRATDPKDMMREKSPIGLQNDEWLLKMNRYASISMACWGSLGNYLNRDQEVIGLIKRLHYLTLTKGGLPGHPLYLKKTLMPIALPCGNTGGTDNES